MKRRSLGAIAIFALSFSILSCQKDVGSQPSELTSGDEIVAVDFATRTQDSEVYEFAEDDQITIVGAAAESIVFTYNSNGEWISIEPYEWLENPTTVYAYYGSAATIEDGDQMADVYCAEYDCNGSIPTNGTISFIDGCSFKHTAALVRVKINNWGDVSTLNVTLSELHNIGYVTSEGKYQTDDQIRSIQFTKVDTSEDYLLYEAKVPAGDYSTPNILDGYSLYVGSVNIFEHIANEKNIPTFFSAGEVYTFTINDITE